jgi:NADH:ubiquinone oxidoreductase subunit K
MVALFADLVPSGDPDIGVFVAIMLAGFFIGIAGHVVRSNVLVIVGIALVFLGTVALPLIVFGSGTE